MKNSTVLFLFVSATMLHTVGATQTITHCQNNGVFGISCQTELSPIEAMRQESMRMNAEIEMQRRLNAEREFLEQQRFNQILNSQSGVNAQPAQPYRPQGGVDMSALEAMARIKLMEAQAKEIRCKGRLNCK